MTFNKLCTYLLIGGLFFSSCSDDDNMPVTPELSNEEKARNFNLGLGTNDVSVLEWMADDYIQHNLTQPTGKAALEPFYDPSNQTDVTIVRSFQDGDFVFAQSIFGFGGNEFVFFDVWRFDNGIAVEHWDNSAFVFDDGDGTTQTDGVTTPVSDTESTESNRNLLQNMTQTLFINGDWTKVRDFFDIDNYVQHSAGAGADGTFLASLEGQNNVPFYDEVKFIHVSGNFGIVASQGPDITNQDPDGDYAYYDLFRMEGGKIVEHWDAISKIEDQSTWAHNNGKWGDDKIILPDGANITLRNTLEEGNPETAFPILFGEAEDAFDEQAQLSYDNPEFATALAQNGVEFMGNTVDLSGLYRIDITGNSIKFRLLPEANDPFWQFVFGVFPAGKFDRYYLTFDQPHNITSFSSSNSSVSLRVDSPTVVVVEITEGYSMNPGTSFNISLN